MASIKHLKNQARHEEQRENWARAIELYGEALEQSAASGEGLPDLSLYNRIGDLHLRQNDPTRAVKSYLDAVERYAEQELYGGAIALCDKILRVAPERVDVYRTLGRLHAATGLVAEARTNFLEYAARLEEQGDQDGPIEAFLELARLTSDRELHLEMIDRLLQGGRREEATEELAQLYDGVAHDGPIGRAVRERLESLAPEILARYPDEVPSSPEPPLDPEQAVREAEERGDLRAALEATDALVEADPDRVSVYRKRVELASGLEDGALLVRSYLELACCLERSGSDDAALTVHRRILELEPDHHQACQALRVAREKSESTGSGTEADSGREASVPEAEMSAPEPTDAGPSDSDPELAGAPAGAGAGDGTSTTCSSASGRASTRRTTRRTPRRTASSGSPCTRWVDWRMRSVSSRRRPVLPSRPCVPSSSWDSASWRRICTGSPCGC